MYIPYRPAGIPTICWLGLLSPFRNTRSKTVPRAERNARPYICKQTKQISYFWMPCVHPHYVRIEVHTLHRSVTRCAMVRPAGYDLYSDMMLSMWQTHCCVLSLLEPRKLSIKQTEVSSIRMFTEASCSLYIEPFWPSMNIAQYHCGFLSYRAFHLPCMYMLL